MIRATTKSRAGVIFIASMLLAFQMGEKINKTSAGLAIKGYDPVAYFEDGKPLKGNAAYQFQWKGATWQFSSAAHREAFTKDSSCVLLQPMPRTTNRRTKSGSADGHLGDVSRGL